MNISILIPCYNEEKTISSCIDSCLNQTFAASEIVVVNDGSTDGSLDILKSYGKRIRLVNVINNSGSKSKAQEIGLRYVSGDYVITTDADTLLDKDFVLHMVKRIILDDPDAIAGSVRSIKNNILTSIRELDYLVGQSIYKKARAYINSIFIIPGCSACYRTKMLKEEVKFEHDTLTEDLDITYKLHGNNKKIAFEENVIAYTQDPNDLNSYANQMRRWYAGQWQNLSKNAKHIKGLNQIIIFGLYYTENLSFSMLLFIAPLFNLNYSLYMNIGLIAYSLLMGFWGMIKRKRIDLFLHSPFYIFAVYLNSFIFIEQFVKEYVLRRNNLYWFKPARREIL